MTRPNWIDIHPPRTPNDHSALRRTSELVLRQPLGSVEPWVQRQEWSDYFTGYTFGDASVGIHSPLGVVKEPSSAVEDIRGWNAVVVRLGSLSDYSLFATNDLSNDPSKAWEGAEKAFEAFDTRNIESEFQLVPVLSPISLIGSLLYNFEDVGYGAFDVEMLEEQNESVTAETLLSLPATYLEPADEFYAVEDGRAAFATNTVATIRRVDDFGWQPGLLTGGTHHDLCLVIGGHKFPVIVKGVIHAFWHLGYAAGNLMYPEQRYAPNENSFAFAASTGN